MSLIRSTVAAGSAHHPNEDWIRATPTAMVLLDGAGGPAELANGCPHGTAWYVHQLGCTLHTLLTRPDHHLSTLPALLAQAITTVAATHPDCDLTHPGTPSTTVVALRQRPGQGWDHLVLSDSTLILQPPGQELIVVCDDRIDTIAPTEKAAMESHQLGTSAHQRHRIAKVERERTMRNIEGGYWVAAADPTVSDQALTGSVPSLDRAVLLSDGAARWLGFTHRGPRELLQALDEVGPDGVIGQVRGFEAQDPTGTRLPRPKAADDAAIVDARLNRSPV
ncbi:integrase [Nocardiopsis metallicus]|uniref:Integrase n=1 Tax=Nocardiopsis metallicus TaxID=179819 RepID=A0A840WF68_9ACTN|nr:integrase [Nocardiopsis metallicus]MBB5494754.1 hypothetical protein [Nocardiopsis metallicus]